MLAEVALDGGQVVQLAITRTGNAVAGGQNVSPRNQSSSTQKIAGRGKLSHWTFRSDNFESNQITLSISWHGTRNSESLIDMSITIDCNSES